MNELNKSFDIKGILAYQQNRYPMLFIDGITDCVPGKYAKGYKLFSYNEWYFHGFDTGSPKVWNVVQIEAMSQIFLMTFFSDEKMQGKIAMSNKFNNVQFLKRIEPGDRLDLHADLLSFSRGVARGNVKGFVDGTLTCTMDCIIVVPEMMIGANLISSQPIQKTKILEKNYEAKIDFGTDRVRECLLNKYPWLFIDRVLEIEPGKFVRSIKNFTYNEHFFPTHFPLDPSVPGFIQIETCMQNFLLTFLSLDGFKRQETADRSLSNVVLKRKVVPGETFEVKAYLDSFKRGIAKGRVESFVNSEPATSFEVTAVVLSEFNKFIPS